MKRRKENLPNKIFSSTVSQEAYFGHWSACDQQGNLGWPLFLVFNVSSRDKNFQVLMMYELRNRGCCCCCINMFFYEIRFIFRLIFSSWLLQKKDDLRMYCECTVNVLSSRKLVLWSISNICSTFGFLNYHIRFKLMKHILKGIQISHHF